MTRFNSQARSYHALVVTILALVLSSCGHRPVYLKVPPRVDVEQYGRVGLVTFTVENAKGQLNELATRRFSEALLDAQRVEVMELGSADSVMRRLGETQMSAASAQSVGASRDVPAVLAGHIKHS